MQGVALKNIVGALLIFITLSSKCYADNPSFRRHVYWQYNGNCKVREWFVDGKYEISGDRYPDGFFYAPVIRVNQDPFCREISKPDKYLEEI